MSGPNVSVTEFKGLSEPINKLIEAARAAIGVWFEPTQIRRKATADAEAAVVLAEANAKVMDITARAQARIANKEAKRQKNIESIMQKAAEALPEMVNDQPVDEDWTARFFEECQDVKNEEMQGLWAKLLAGEVAQPGRFSLRTLALMKVMRKEEANLFTQLCSRVWMVGGRATALLFDANQAPPHLELAFEGLSHLETLDLIRFESLTGFNLTFNSPMPRTTVVSVYYGKVHILRLPEGVKNLPLGNVLLTSIGRELVSVAGGHPDEAYRIQTVERWRQANIEVQEL